MKKLILFVFSLFITFSQTFTLSAQTCMADAGEDYHWCRNVDSITILPLGDSVIFLGGNPTATGGTPPYTYEWSMDPLNPWPGAYFYASDFLDDITSPNPMLWATEGNTMVFYLRVEDSNGIVCRDTIMITASSFAFHLGSYHYTINEGDSIQLIEGPNVAPTEWPVDSLIWRPNHGIISDSAISTPWVKPTRDISYYNVVWDSKGCRQAGTSFYHITVNKIGTPSFNPYPDLKVFPSIVSIGEVIYVKAPIRQNMNTYDFLLYDMHGKTLFRQKIVHEIEEIPVEKISPGVYVFRIMSENKCVKTGKIVIQ